MLQIELEEALKYYKYYFPQNAIPKVYTYISGLQYEYPIQMADDVMIIGLDLYLGSNFEAYREIGIPEYKISRMNPELIAVDFMKELAHNILPAPVKSPNFLDEIIRFGKIMYFLDASLPNKADHNKIGYPPEKLAWCFANESNLWAFIIDQEILFTSNYQIIRKLVNDGPFTAGFSNNSPARIGGWIGWQIVRSYMDNNPEITLDELLKNTNANLILSNSKYKPTK